LPSPPPPSELTNASIYLSLSHHTLLTLLHAHGLREISNSVQWASRSAAVLGVHGLAGSTTASAEAAKAAASKAAPLAKSYNAIVKNVAVPGLQNGMDYVTLGDSDLVVSKVCMGTMNFGCVRTVMSSSAFREGVVPYDL
jgi:hypothetical protein